MSSFVTPTANSNKKPQPNSFVDEMVWKNNIFFSSLLYYVGAANQCYSRFSLIPTYLHGTMKFQMDGNHFQGVVIVPTPIQMEWQAK